MHIITGGTTDNIEFNCMYDAALISPQDMEKDGLFGFYGIASTLNDAPSILWFDKNMEFVKGELLHKCVNCEHCGKNSTGFFDECLNFGFHIDDTFEHSCEEIELIKERQE